MFFSFASQATAQEWKSKAEKQWEWRTQRARRLQRRVVEVPALLHQAAEPRIGIGNEGLDRRARFRGGRLIAVRGRLER